MSQIPDEELRKFYENQLSRRPAEQRNQPFFWGQAAYNQSTQPVVGISWYEALAYCAWLEGQVANGKGQGAGGQWPVVGEGAFVGLDVTELVREQGYRLRLPTEMEWEKAAGWDAATGQKRIYPWGNEWDASKTNVEESGIGRPSAVGIFPGGAAPCGALDMSGNVWEWMLTSWGSFDYNAPGFRYPYSEAYPQTQPGGREAVDTLGFRTLRGGGWADLQRSARVAYRYFNHPGNVYDNYGLRCVVVPPVLS